MLKNNNYFFQLSDVVFIMLIKVKMPTIVGILTFMSMVNFMLSPVEHEKFYRLGVASCSSAYLKLSYIYSTKVWHKNITVNRDSLELMVDRSYYVFIQNTSSMFLPGLVLNILSQNHFWAGCDEYLLLQD